jgi:hypothetical protein
LLKVITTRGDGAVIVDEACVSWVLVEVLAFRRLYGIECHISGCMILLFYTRSFIEGIPRLRARQFTSSETPVDYDLMSCIIVYQFYLYLAFPTF